MRRRKFITLIGGAAATWPLAARAQAPFKIGLLDTGVGPSFTDAFMRKLGELGYADGRNVVFVRKAAEGDTGRLKDLAADLVAQRVDVIVTMGTPAGFAAKQATGTIPIVLGANSDPVGVGLVASSRQARRQCHRHVADGAGTERQAARYLAHAVAQNFPLCDFVGFVEPRHGRPRA